MHTDLAVYYQILYSSVYEGALYFSIQQAVAMAWRNLKRWPTWPVLAISHVLYAKH